MPLAELDTDFARGKRRPPPIPGKGAQMNVDDVRQAAVFLENKLRAFLLDSTEKAHCLHMLDSTLCYAEALILRYDRNGPPANESLLQRLEGFLRLNAEFPEQFKGVNVEDLRKEAAKLAKLVGTPKTFR